MKNLKSSNFSCNRIWKHCLVITGRLQEICTGGQEILTCKARMPQLKSLFFTNCHSLCYYWLMLCKLQLTLLDLTSINFIFELYFLLNHLFLGSVCVYRKCQSSMEGGGSKIGSFEQTYLLNDPTNIKDSRFVSPEIVFSNDVWQMKIKII